MEGEYEKPRIALCELPSYPHVGTDELWNWETYCKKKVSEKYCQIARQRIESAPLPLF